MRIPRSGSALILLLLAVLACNLPGTSPQSPAPPTPVGATPTFELQQSPSQTPSPTAEAEAAGATAAPQMLRMAYVLDGNVWGFELGSAPADLIGSGMVIDLRMSDDGQRIAYLELDPTSNLVELRSVRFDGSDERLLLDQADFDALYPLEEFLHYAPSQMAMVPGTHQLLFNTRAVFEGPGLAKNDDLIRLDADTGELQMLLGRGQGGDFAFSPDGSQLALVRSDGLGFVNSDGNDLRAERFSYSRVITYSEYLFYPLPTWVGNAVLMAIPGEDPFFGPQAGDLWRVPADEGEPELLASLDADLFGPQSSAAVVAPDGTRAAFFRRIEGTGDSQLWIYDLNGGVETLYAEGALTWRGWAPDSSHFLYSQGSGIDLFLGQAGAAPAALGSGRGLRWLSASDYLYLADTPGGWTFRMGTLGTPPSDLIEIGDGFSSYDYSN